MKIITLLLLTLVAGCTDEPRSRRVLEEAGYSSIQITGYAFGECSDSDDYHTEFSAKGPTGKSVTGAVCCGIVKSCTIRIR